MASKFAEALNKRSPSPTRTVEKVAGSKHIGGYFDPAVAKQLRVLAAEEDRTITALVAEGLDLLFQSRGKPTIAQKLSGRPE